jgi:cell division protein FtsA
MIDLGAAKTGHVLYEAGEVKDYGCHRTGSADVTNDLSMAFGTPWERAEALKIQSSSVMAVSRLVDAEDRWKFQERGGRYSDGEMKHVIIYFRWRQILEKVKARLVENGARLDRLGAGIHLTGGGSLQSGLVELASEVFGAPAFRASAKGFIGDEKVIQNPQYSCAIGLLKLREWRSENDPRLNSGRRYFGVLPV